MDHIHGRAIGAWPRRKLGVAWTLVVAALGGLLASARPSPAIAIETPLEQVIPDSPPIPVTGLLYQVQGVPAAVGSLAGITLSNPTAVTAQPPDPVTGRFLRFAAGTQAGSTLTVEGTKNPFLIAYTPANLTPLSASGTTVSFWYRHPTGAAKVKGWNPLVVLGDDWGTPDTWRHGIVLNDGSPMVARRGTTELFDAKSVAAKTASGTTVTGAIDDSAWHHLALRFARPGCAPNNCPGGDRVVLTLFVDGKVAGEEVVTLAADGYKLFVGTLANGALYAAQNNWDNTNKRLNTIADIDDILVYGAALSMSELHQVRWARQRGMVWQWPPAEAQYLGISGPKAAIGGISPTILASRTGPLELTKSFSTAAAGQTLDGRAQLEGLTAHTFAAWAILPDASNTEVVTWRPVTGKGWRISVAGMGTLRIHCLSSGTTTDWAVPGWVHNTPHLLTVQAALGKLQVSFDQRIAPAVTCFDASATATNTATLEWPSNNVGLTMAVLYRGLRTHSELAAIAAPGPALWLNLPNLTNLSGLGIAGLANSGSGSQFAVAPNVPGTIHRILADLSNMWLSAKGQSEEEITVAFDIKVDQVDTGNRWFTPIRRMVPNNPNAYNFNLVMYCHANPDNCKLHVMVPAANGKMQGFYFGDFGFTPGKTVRIAVAWPLTRVLLPAPGQTGPTLTVQEPGVTIDGVFTNRRYSTDPNKLTPVTWLGLENAPAAPAGTATQLQIGSLPNETGTTKFTLSNVRIYPRAIDDSQRVGGSCALANCGEAGQNCEVSTTSKTAICTTCMPGTYNVGGVGATESDCRMQLPFGEPCRSDNMCTTGVCSAGRCAANQASIAQCQTACLELGRACTQQGSVYACGGCQAGFELMPGSTLSSPDAQYTCGWAPKKKWRDDCANDWECESGACREVELSSQDYYDFVLTTVTKSGYDNDGCTGGCSWQQAEISAPHSFWKRATRKAKVCLAKETTECTDLPWKTSVSCSESVVLPGGLAGVAHYCSTGKDAPCANPNFSRQNPVLAPSACQAAAVRWQQVQSGGCSYQYDWGDVRCEDRSNASAADSAGLTTMKKTAGLSLADLKQVFLSDTSAWKTSDVGALRGAGVGPLLIEYAAGNAQQKAKMVQQYGQFEPLQACAPNQADWSGGKANFAYHKPGNELTCMPVLQPDGAVCPPPGETLPGKEFCRSNYCNRATKICERGDNPLGEVRGEGGNKQKEGKSAVKFGLVRVDDTEVEMAEEQPNNNEFRYSAELGNRYVPCILGKGMPDAGLFAIDISLDRMEGPDCGKAEVSTLILGMKLTSPKPDAAVGSCTGYGVTVGSGFSVCTEGPGCTPVNPADLISASTLASMKIPAVKFCAPWEEMGLTLPEAKKDFKEFLVPLYISIGLALDACISYSIGLDGQGLPQIEFKPNAGVGVEAKGGVGVAETGAYEFGAGVRLVLTLVDIAFPITWGIVMNDVQNSAGQYVLGLLKLEIVQKISLVYEILGGEFGLFAEFSIGPLSFEWTFNLFTWKGLSFTFDLSEIPLFSTVLDFREQFYNALNGAASQACDSGPCYK